MGESEFEEGEHGVGYLGLFVLARRPADLWTKEMREKFRAAGFRTAVAVNSKGHYKR